jgi:hypothetical protein
MSTSTPVTFTARDAIGNEVTFEVTFHINAAVLQSLTTPTTIDQITTQTFNIGSGVSFDVSSYFSNPIPGQAVVYSATGLPAGLSIDASTGVITGWTKDVASTNSVSISLTNYTYPTRTFLGIVLDSDVDITIDGVYATLADGTNIKVLGPTVITTNGSPLTRVVPLAPIIDDNFSISVRMGNVDTPHDYPWDVYARADETGRWVYIKSMLSGSVVGGIFTSLMIAQVLGLDSSANGTQTFGLNIIDVPPTDAHVNPFASSYIVGDTVSVNVASMFDNTDSSNTLTYSSTTLPAGLSLDANSGSVTGTLTLDQANVNTAQTVTITATDLSNISVNVSVVISVLPSVQTITVISQPSSTTVSINGSVSSDTSTFVSNSPQNAPLSYTSMTLPSWLTLNSSTGVITGTAPLTTGLVSFAVDVTNGVTTVQVPYSITVADVVPTLSGINPVPSTFTQNDVVSISLTGMFIESVGGNTLTYTATGLPTGLSLDSTTGIISGTVPVSESDTVTSLSITATDINDGSVTASAPYLIYNAQSPTILLTGETRYYGEGDVISLDLSTVFSNPNHTGTLTFSTTTLPEGLTLSGSVISGTISVGDAAGIFGVSNGGSIITFTATTSQGLSSTATMDVFISLPLIVSSTPVTPISQSINTALTYPTALYFTEPTVGAAVSYTALNLPVGTTIDSTTGNISGTPTVVETGSILVTASWETETATISIPVNLNNINVVFLMSGTGTNGSTTITDSSTHNHTISIVGTAPTVHIDTTMADPFGNYNGVIRLPPNGGSLLVTPVSDFPGGTIDAVFEGFVYLLDTSSYYGRLFCYGSGEHFGLYITGTTLFGHCTSINEWTWNLGTIPVGQWVYVAMVKKNNLLYLHVDNVVTTNGAGYDFTSSGILLGGDGNSWGINCYLSNWRVTSVLTPDINSIPTAPF